MRILLISILIIACFISCKEKTNGRLISFNYQFLRDLKANEIDTMNEGNPINYNITKEQKADTLSIVVDFPWSGCAKFDGDIVFAEDSLTLFYFQKSETLCSELIFYRLNYKVLNKEKKDYIITVKNRRK